MDIEKIEKYIKTYLDDVITPEINDMLVGEDDEPIVMSLYKVRYGESNPNRISIFIDMEPDYSKGSISNKIYNDLSNFLTMLGLEKTLHVYYNKRPLF